jgi:hypothetical protein
MSRNMLQHCTTNKLSYAVKCERVVWCIVVFDRKNKTHMQNVRMKGIQNTKYISRKLIVIQLSGLCHRKGKL